MVENYTTVENEKTEIPLLSSSLSHQPCQSSTIQVINHCAMRLHTHTKEKKNMMMGSSKISSRRMYAIYGES